MIRMRPRILVAAASLVVIAACGGKSGTISLKAITSPSDDPFGDAATVRVIIGNNTRVMTTPVNMGHFTLDVPATPGSSTTQITVEALDTAGNVLAWGRTPAVLTTPVDQGPYGVWVARPATVRPAASALTVPRTDLATTNIVGLGAVLAGGRDATGAAVNSATVYDVYTSSIIDVASMNQARAGAVMTASSTVQAIVFGGAQQAGFGNSGGAINNAELFDPSSGMGLWAAVQNAANQTVDAHAYAMSAPVGSQLLVVGGLNNGQPVATGVYIVTGAMPLVTQLTQPMAAPRAGGVAVAATFPEGAGALIFGGLAAGSTGPVAERAVGTSFMDYSAGFAGIASRTGAVGVALSDGRVLIAGGRDAMGVHADGFVVTPAVPAQVAMLPNLMSSPRELHVATMVGGDVLICDGADNTGMLPASCDLIDGNTLQRTTTLPTGLGRKGASAVALETGPVLIAGGVGSDNMPTAAVEIYTPAEPALPAM